MTNTGVAMPLAYATDAREGTLTVTNVSGASCTVEPTSALLDAGQRIDLPDAKCSAAVERRDDNHLLLHLDFHDSSPLPWLRYCTPYITESVTTRLTDVSRYWQLLSDAGALNEAFAEQQRRYAATLEAYFASWSSDRDNRFDWFEWDGTRLVGHIGLYRISEHVWAYYDLVRVRTELGVRQRLIDSFFVFTSDAIGALDGNAIIAGSWKPGHRKWDGFEDALRRGNLRDALATSLRVAYYRHHRGNAHSEFSRGPLEVDAARLIASVLPADSARAAHFYLDRNARETPRTHLPYVLQIGASEYLVISQNLPHGLNVLRTAEMSLVFPLSSDARVSADVAHCVAASDEGLELNAYGCFIATATGDDADEILDLYFIRPHAFRWWR